MSHAKLRDQLKIAKASYRNNDITLSEYRTVVEQIDKEAGVIADENTLNRFGAIIN